MKGIEEGRGQVWIRVLGERDRGSGCDPNEN